MKQPFKKIFFLLSISISIAAHPTRSSALFAIIQKLRNSHSQYIYGTQLELIQALKKTDIPNLFSPQKPKHRNLLGKTIWALELKTKKTPPPLSPNACKTIQSACKTFYKTPGFQRALLTILQHAENPNFLKGYLFELEVAVQLVKQNIKIERINSIIKSGGKTHEFDLKTKNNWIECKNITWKHAPVDRTRKWTESLKRQFLGQKHVVDTYNETHNKKIKYTVYSKNHIPENWKLWFAQENINVVEFEQNNCKKT